MNEWTQEPTLEDVQREFPDWLMTRGTDRFCHAWPPDHGTLRHVRGEDPMDLRDMIIREIWHSTGQVHER